MSAVFVIRWTASAAMSSGPMTRPDRQRRAELLAARVELVAEQRRRQRRVDEPGRDQVHPDRARARARGSSSSPGTAAVSAEMSARPGAVRRPPVPPMKSRRPPGRTRPTACRATCSGSSRWASRSRRAGVEVEVLQRRVVGAGAGDQHVVDRPGQLVEEPPEAVEVGGVERGDAGAELVAGLRCRRSGLRAVMITSAPSRARAPRGLEPDAGAAADHDDGLAGEARHAGSSCPVCSRARYSA